jgi:uncharacterized membrane protein YcaP (DUF421 family)
MNETLEIAGSVALRATVIYLALLVLLRIGGRRELAQLTPADILLLLLLSEAVSPALSGGQSSIAAGLLSAAILIGLTFSIGWLTFRSRRFEALVEGNPLVLVREGRLDAKLLRSMRITDQQLRTFLHEHGVLRVDQIAMAYVEPSGKVTVVKEEEMPEPRNRESQLFDERATIAEIKAKLEELERALQQKRMSRPSGRFPASPSTDKERGLA